MAEFKLHRHAPGTPGTLTINDVRVGPDNVADNPGVTLTPQFAGKTRVFNFDYDHLVSELVKRPDALRTLTHAMLNVLRGSTDDPKVKLAFDILAGDPMALDVAGDVLARGQ